MLNSAVAARLASPVPVIGQIREGAFILELRCIEDEADFLAPLQCAAHLAGDSA